MASSLSRVASFSRKKVMPNAGTLRNEQGKEFRPIFIQEYPIKMNQVMLSSSNKKK